MENSRLPSRAEYLTWRASALGLIQIMVSHLLLGAWFYFGFQKLPLSIYIPLSLLASVIHQKYLSEWVHEAAHFNFIKDRQWNDWLINILAESLFVTDIEAHRDGHMQHHAKKVFFDEADPDTRFFGLTHRKEFWRGVLYDLTGITALRMFFQRGSQPTKTASSSRVKSLILISLVHLFLIASFFILRRLDIYFLYYFTLATIYPLVNRLRVYGQHVQIEENGQVILLGSMSSRTIDAGLFDRVFFTSQLMMYHHEHHLYPSLPYKALKSVCARAGNVNQFSQSRGLVLVALYKSLK